MAEQGRLLGQRHVGIHRTRSPHVCLLFAGQAKPVLPVFAAFLVQKREAAQVARLFDRRTVCQQNRRHHRRLIGVGEAFRFAVCPTGVVEGEPQRQLGLLGAEFDQPRVDVQHHIDVRIGAPEAVQPRDQPAGGQRGVGAHPGRLGLAACGDIGQHSLDAVETGGQLREQGLARLGQHHLAVQALEQRGRQRGFQFADLAADCRLRNVQFLGGAAEARVTAGDLEGSQGGEGQAAALHSHNLRLFEGRNILV